MRSPILLLATLLLATLALGGEVEPKIVGGTEVTPQFKYPWLAVLYYKGQFICGGTLIDPSYILTASHCSYVGPASSLSVSLHRHDITKTDSAEDGIHRTVSKVIMHPDFNSDLIRPDYALWKLSSPVNDVELVTLDVNGTSFAEGDDVLLMGWGATSSGGDSSNVLLQTTAQVWNFATCDNYYQGLLTSVYQVCAGTVAGGKDTCQGDSGGPMFINKEGTLIQIGVVSFGDGCALANVPAVYAYVNGALGFIEDAKDDTKTSNCNSDSCPSTAFCIESVNTGLCATPSSSIILIPSFLVALVALFLSLTHF